MAMASRGILALIFALCALAAAQPEVGAPWPLFSTTHGRFGGWRAAPTTRCAFPKGGEVIAHGSFSSIDVALSVSKEGVVFAGFARGNVVALNASSFETLWTFSTSLSFASPPAISNNGLVYVGNAACVNSGTFFAINAQTGVAVWSYVMLGSVNAPAVIGADGTVYVGSLGGDFVAFNPDTGAVKWVRQLGYIWYSAAVSDSKGLVFVADVQQGLFALDIATGSTVWHTPITGEAYPAPAIAPNGLVIFGTHQGEVYALAPRSGRIVWSATSGEDITSFAITPAGSIIYGDVSGDVIALSMWTGRVVWQTNLGDGVQSAPAVGYRGRVVYVGCNDGKLYALSATSGKTLWSFATDASIGSSAPAIGARGELYILNSGGSSYAVTCGASDSEGDEEGEEDKSEDEESLMKQIDF